MRTVELSDEQVFAAFRGVLIDRDNIAHYRGLDLTSFCQITPKCVEGGLKNILTYR